MPLRPPLPKEHRNQMRQFYRLLLSYGDFKHAKLVAQYILDERLHNKYPGETTVLLQALNCSMIMAYTRPFSGNSGRRGESIPDLPDRFVQMLSDEEQEIHRIVLVDRHKYLAHSDGEAAALEPVRFRVSDEIETLIPLVADRLAPLNEEPTRLLLSAATKLFEATLRERMDMEQTLLPYFRVATPDTLYNDTSDA